MGPDPGQGRARSKRGSKKPPSPSEVDEIISQVNKDKDSPVTKVKRAKAPPKDEKYKLTGFISKDLFRRMKMHCVSSEMTIREFLESAISEYLPE